MRDPWDGTDDGEKRIYRMRDNEPHEVDGITLPPRDEDFVRRHGGNGRPYVRIMDPTGKVLVTETTYSRCTTFIKCVDRNEALERWEQRKALEGFALFPDQFQAEVISAGDSKPKLDGVWLRAKNAGGAEILASRGTAMHRVAEWYDLGQVPPILPEIYAKALTGWIEMTKYFRWKYIEKFMVHDELKVAGTPDRVGEYLPCQNCGRRFYIFDLKTGRVDQYTELQIAMQLGMYSNSAFYNVHTGERETQDWICRCKAITLKLDIDSAQGTCYWTDIYTGYQIAHDLAPQIHAARTEKGLLVPFQPIPDLFMFINSAEKRSELKSLYARHKDLWTDDHTKAATVRLKEIQ